MILRLQNSFMKLKGYDMLRLAILIALVLVSLNVFAASSGSLNLQGLIPTVVSITVDPVGPYNSLDLTQTQTDTLVANVLEESNTALGYTVEVSSLNNAQLVHSSGSVVGYSITYNDIPVGLATTPVVVTSSAASTSPVSITKSVKISYTGQVAATKPAGAYVDTVTFTITSP